jgi:acylphosphatase
MPFNAPIRDVSNPVINAGLEALFGRNLIPSRFEGEDMIDALNRRNRTFAFRDSAANSFADNPIIKHLGEKGAKTLGSVDSLTGGKISGLLSPFIGGNTYKATENIHNMLNNPATMSAFAQGNHGSKNIMNALNRNFYKHGEHDNPAGSYINQNIGELPKVTEPKSISFAPVDNIKKTQMSAGDAGFSGRTPDQHPVSNPIRSAEKGIPHKSGKSTTSKIPMGRMPAPMSKMAEKDKSDTHTYKMEGNVQGVGLRKALHKILDEHRLKGLAVNYPETNEVYATIQGRKKRIDQILEELKARLAVREKKPLTYGTDYSIEHAPAIQEKMRRVVFAPKDIDTFEQNNPELDKFRTVSLEDKLRYFEDRYRLNRDAKGKLRGSLPNKAIDQLFNGAPVYHRQVLARNENNEKAAFYTGFVKRAAEYGFSHEDIVKLASIEKKAAPLSGVVKAFGGKAMPKIFNMAKGAFGNLRSFGKSVPEGPLFNERNAALEAGNKFINDFKPEGFRVYAGRVKTPESLAGHGYQTTNDLLGIRVSPNKGGYTQENVSELINQLNQAGINVTGQKKLVRPGYHGWNIKGTLPHATGSVPLEVQMTPRRMQGIFAADHAFLYKPETSGVSPVVAKGIYKPILNYATNVLSPMADPLKRVGYGAAGAAAGVGAMKALGGGGYTALRPPNQKNSPVVESAPPVYDRVPASPETILAQQNR